MTDKIITLLNAYNISQRQIAEHMGISPQALYERIRRKDVALSTLQGIANAINIELSELIAQLSAQPRPQIDELTYLRRENELLKRILEEKERFIELLIKEKSGD